MCASARNMGWHCRHCPAQPTSRLVYAIQLTTTSQLPPVRPEKLCLAPRLLAFRDCSSISPFRAAGFMLLRQNALPQIHCIQYSQELPLPWNFWGPARAQLNRARVPVACFFLLLTAQAAQLAVAAATVDALYVTHLALSRLTWCGGQPHCLTPSPLAPPP
jgi:hypothetical protein